jgi:hypothetical protein
VSATYKFPGVRSYLAAAASSHANASGRYFGHALKQNPVMRIQGLLAQAVEAKGPAAAVAASRATQIAECVKWRDVLALAVDGCEAAILDVCTNLSLTPPTFAKNTNET